MAVKDLFSGVMKRIKEVYNGFFYDGAEAPAPQTPNAQTPTEASPPAGSGGGNTILYILLGVMATVAGLLGGILIGGRNKAKASDSEKKGKDKE